MYVCVYVCIYIYIILYMLFTYLYIYKSFSTMLDKGLGKNNHKKRDGEIGKHKLNEMEAMNMREKQTR